MPPVPDASSVVILLFFLSKNLHISKILPNFAL
nr:MAG TPA: hypothetical protein [Crassvirales sp.]